MSKPDKQAFFVIPFGRPDVDEVWSKVYKPVANLLGFNDNRIDEKDDGKIKIDQIYNQLSTADIIISDLTHKRPNCYFETGYAMAKRKDEVVILCAKKGHKVHFDLLPYNVMRWDPENIDDFKTRFRKRLCERMELISTRTAIPESVRETPARERSKSMVGLENLAKRIRREVTS